MLCALDTGTTEVTNYNRYTSTAAAVIIAATATTASAATTLKEADYRKARFRLRQI